MARDPESVLTTLHLDVTLSLAEILELADGRIPATLAEYVEVGTAALAKGYYGLAVAEAVKRRTTAKGAAA